MINRWKIFHCSRFYFQKKNIIKHATVCWAIITITQNAPLFSAAILHWLPLVSWENNFYEHIRLCLAFLALESLFVSLYSYNDLQPCHHQCLPCIIFHKGRLQNISKAFTNNHQEQGKEISIIPWLFSSIASVPFCWLKKSNLVSFWSCL